MAVALAVTVGEDPALPVRTATATPSAPVVVPVVMNPEVVVKVTVKPLSGKPFSSRTVATTEAVGGSPLLIMLATIEISCGVPVAEDDEVGLSAHAVQMASASTASA